MRIYRSMLGFLLCLSFFESAFLRASQTPDTALSYKQILLIVSEIAHIQELIIAYVKPEIKWQLWAIWRIQNNLGPRISFSPQEKYIAYSNSQNKQIKLWDLTTKQAYTMAHPLVVHEPDRQKQDNTYQLLFTKTNNLILTEGFVDRLTKVTIAFDTGYTLCESMQDNIHNYHEPLYTVAVSPSGKFIATGAYHSSKRKTVVRLWDLDARNCVKTYLSDNKNAHIIVSPKDSYLCSIGSKSAPVIEIWDLHHDSVMRINELNTYGIIGLHFCQNEDEIVYAIVTVSDQRDCIKKWNHRTQKQLWHMYVSKLHKHENLSSLAVSPTEKFFAFNFYAPKTNTQVACSTVRIYDEYFFDSIDFSLEEHAQLFFSPDGNYLVAASPASSFLYIWKKSELAPSMGHNGQLVKRQSTLSLLHKLLPTS